MWRLRQSGVIVIPFATRADAWPLELDDAVARVRSESLDAFRKYGQRVDSLCRDEGCTGRLRSGAVVQWGARRHGNAGTYESYGNVVSASCRF